MPSDVAEAPAAEQQPSSKPSNAAEAPAVVLASLQVMEVLKILVVMDLLVLAVHQIKTEKVKQVLTHHLTLVVMVAVVVHMEKVAVEQEVEETEEIKLTLHKVVALEVPTEVEEVHQVIMGMV